MLDVSSIKFKWSNEVKFEFNLQISQGEIVTIEGPSGIGKSTLINLISGFLKPESGAIFWFNKRIDKLSPRERPTSTIFQSDNLFEHLSCLHNASLGISPRGKLAFKEQEKINNLFLELGINDLKNRKPNEISGGQQARVSLVRALLSKKPILLLDEPVSSLDQKTREETLNVLKKTSKKYKLTLIIVSHHNDDRELLNARQIKLT